MIATARRLETIQDLRSLGITTLQLDVTNEDSIAKCKGEVQELTGGHLEFLVNNASVDMTKTVSAGNLLKLLQRCFPYDTGN